MVSKLPGGGGIHIDPANKGKLHKTLGVPAGKKLTTAQLTKAKNSESPTTRKRANFALSAKKWTHK